MAIDMDVVRDIMNFREPTPSETDTQLAGVEAQAAPPEPSAPTQAADAQAPAPAEPAGQEKAAAVEDLLKEYGVEADPETPEFMRQQLESYQARIADLDAELAATRMRASDRVYGMTAEEVNDKVEDLKEKGRHAEATELLKKWSQRDEFTPEAVTKARRVLAEKELQSYAAKSPHFVAVAGKPELQAFYKQVEPIINMDRPGAARVLHLAIKGLMAGEMIKRGYEMGRMSVTMRPPGSTATQAVTAPNQQEQSQPRQRLSDLLMPSNRT